MATEFNKWEKTYTSKSNHNKEYKYRKDNGSLIKILWHFCGGYKVEIYECNGDYLVKEQYVSGTLPEVKKIALEMESKL